MKDNELIEILKEFDEKRVEQLNDNARKMFYAIMELADSRDKYKSLYENEKDHTDTLKRIIKKVEHIVINGKLGENLDGTSYYLIHDEIGEKILDLLKEIK